VIVAVGSLAVGILVGVLSLRSLDTGETWWDWRAIEVPRAFNVLSVVIVVSLFAGLLAWFLPAEVRTVLVCVPFGYCVPMFLTGARRWLTRKEAARWQPDEDALEPPEDVPERRPFRKRIASAVLFGAPGAVAAGLVFGAREPKELIMLALIGPFALYVNESVSDRSERWARRHDL
jgi:hypothetical protein